MSRPKEPGYFNTDQPKRLVRSLSSYERLFESAPIDTLIMGEASTGYLSSSCAVENILAYNPNSRFLVCLRNPIDMVPSLHAEYLKSGRLRKRSLEATWREQRSNPASIKNISDDYARVCMLGNQVERLTRQVPRHRIHFVWLDDIKHNPAAQYTAILAFLGMPPDGRGEFPVANSRRVPISSTISSATRLGTRLSYRLGLAPYLRPVGKYVRAITTREPSASETIILSPSLRSEMVTFFAEDIRKLSRIMERDLNHWLQC